MIGINAKLAESAKLVTGLAPVVPSSATPDYVSLKNYEKLTIVISIKNATTVTGSAITLVQAQDVAATGAKALPFTLVHANVDCGASDTLVETAVTNNTFTTATTNSKDLMYVIEVDSNDLDVDNGFDCVRLGTGNAVAATVCATYILRGSRYAGATPPSAIVD